MGEWTPFLIVGGGEVTLVASQFIRLLPGTTVQLNGFLHAFITRQCIPCNSWKISPADSDLLISDGSGNFLQEVERKTTMRVFPNPTLGIFTLEINGLNQTDNVNVEIFTARGEKLQSENFINGHRHQFSLADYPAGIYFIRVITGTWVETVKVIRD